MLKLLALQEQPVCVVTVMEPVVAAAEVLMFVGVDRVGAGLRRLPDGEALAGDGRGSGPQTGRVGWP